MDALEQTLYMNDTNIVHVECEKCFCASDSVDSVGWTELNFWKVVCIDYTIILVEFSCSLFLLK